MRALKLVEPGKKGKVTQTWYLWYDEDREEVRYQLPTGSIFSLHESDTISELIEHIQSRNRLSVVELDTHLTPPQEVLSSEPTA